MQSLLFVAVLAVAGWLAWQAVTRLRDHDRARALAQREAQQVQERVAASLERPGVLPSQPLEAVSAAAIEPRAEAEPCHVCGGRLHTDEHETVELLGQRLRRLDMRCASCGRHMQLYFRLRTSTPMA